MYFLVWCLFLVGLAFPHYYTTGVFIIWCLCSPLTWLKTNVWSSTETEKNQVMYVFWVIRLAVPCNWWLFLSHTSLNSIALHTRFSLPSWLHINPLEHRLHQCWDLLTNFICHSLHMHTMSSFLCCSWRNLIGEYFHYKKATDVCVCAGDGLNYLL